MSLYRFWLSYSGMVIDKAAPVKHIHHGLEAEDGLAGQAGVVGGHHGAGCKLHRLVCLCPGKLLKPNLQR